MSEATIDVQEIMEALSANPNVRAMRRLHRNLELLVGEEMLRVECLDKTPESVVARCTDMNEEKWEAMSVGEKLGYIASKIPVKEPYIDKVHLILDMIFEQRYGWPEGTAKTLSYSQINIALEHAMDHDSPECPSIWEMTKSNKPGE